MTRLAQTVLLIYGVVLAAGGVMGYVAAGSLPSLVAGLVSGAAAVAAGLAVTRYRPQALAAGLLVALAVGAMMLSRYLQSGALMPAGMAVGASAITALVALLALFNPKR